MTELSIQGVNSIMAEDLKNVMIVCPKCRTKDNLRVPQKIINQSKQLTTISIPSKLICEHSFQAFIDKNFKVRGYQQVDFDFSKMEIYEGGSAEDDDESVNKLTNLPLFQDIIQLLRGSVDDNEILGSGIFTIDGHVLYSSLPQGTLTNVIREFETRAEKQLTLLRKMFLELETNEKICSQYMEIQSNKFVLVLFFSNKVKLGMGNLFLRELAKKIQNLEN